HPECWPGQPPGVKLKLFEKMMEIQEGYRNGYTAKPLDSPPRRYGNAKKDFTSKDYKIQKNSKNRQLALLNIYSILFHQ
ncbi:MAG: hypothetical protein M0018_06525, partial [Nitrospiraceae bacterium]|nr:hypothetical protein [Nitrospiraceae bacterium]